MHQQPSTFSSIDADQAVQDLKSRLRSQSRFMLGIVGAPGSGKSTFAARLRDAISEPAVVVPMDGFHLSNAVINGTSKRDRKGAIDTFDGSGYVSLLSRVKEQREPVVYAPDFRRDLDEPVAASIAISKTTRLIITEGNYLLSDEKPWSAIRYLLDEIWFIENPSELRITRLVERHIAFGKDRAAAQDWALGPDQSNARMIESTRDRADRIIQWS